MHPPEATRRVLRKRAWQHAGWMLVVGLGLAWSGSVSDVRLSALFDAQGLESAGEILGGLAHPDLSGAFVARIAWLTLESLAIASLGLLLAIALAIPLAICAARLPDLEDATDRSGLGGALAPVGRGAARIFLIGLRAVPEIVWAFLFVRMLGLGAGPGVLAIGLSFAGVIGRLYAELLESVDPVPVRALRSAGSSRLGVLIFGVLPQVRSQWIGYGLFRYECALRSASILGVVGAGGLGSEIQLSVRYFEFDKLATTLLAVLTLVIVLEGASAVLRRRPAGWSLGVLFVSAFAALGVLDTDLLALGEPANLAQAYQFLLGLSEPTLAPAFWWNTLGLVIETVGIAAFGTTLAAAFAFLLAPLAARTLTLGGFLREPPGHRGLAVFGAAALFAGARLCLQIGRALPDIVWAMLFVVWVGPGPFAGALALAAHTTGLLGRLFGEVYEEAEPLYARALEASGSGRLGVWGYGVLPRVSPRLAAFALFRFEVNLRVTAMIGFVGAGGLGDALHTAISLFHNRDLAALLLALLALVVVVDFASGHLRRRLLEGGRDRSPFLLRPAFHS